MAVYAAQYQINIKVPHLGKIYIASHFTKLSPKAEDKDQACQRIAKKIPTLSGNSYDYSKGLCDKCHSDA